MSDSHGGSQTVQDTLPVLGETLLFRDDENVQTRENLPRPPAHLILLLRPPGLPGPVGRSQRQQTLVEPELLGVVLVLLHLSHQQRGEAGRQEVGGPVGQTVQPDAVQDEAV